MCHFRWLTLANGMLSLHAISSVPSETLESLANFFIDGYERIWFELKY